MRKGSICFPFRDQQLRFLLDLTSNELIVPLPILRHDSPVIPSSVSDEILSAKIGSPKSVYLRLTLAILFVSIERIESTSCSSEDKPIVLLNQAQCGYATGEQSNVSPLVFSLLTLIRETIQVVSTIIGLASNPF